MKVTVEISLYPLKESYTETIIDFISSLKQYDGLTINSTAMSTYIGGEYDLVMDALQQELKNVYKIVPDSATVIKIIPKDLNVEQGFLTF